MITRIRNNKLIVLLLCVAMTIFVSFCFLNTETYAASKKKDKARTELVVGKTYKLAKPSYVYKGPGKKYGVVLRSNLKESSKKYAIKNTKKAKFKKDTVVTCLNKQGKWIKIPSGWIKRANIKL